MAPVWLQAARVRVPAGFPSAAEDQVERIKLMRPLVRHPQATLYLRIPGDSVRLKPENPADQDTAHKKGQTDEVWGVVVATIHQHIA